ncbi:MAG: hypothetical protein AB2554_04460 [Candidatus Thiodiazotropha sp.]
MKHIAIRKHYSYFATDSEAIEDGAFDEKMERLDEDIGALLEKYGLTPLQHETRFIPTEKMSLCHCAQCGNLMINRDKNPARFDGDELYSDLAFIVLDGGSYEGRELCEECLPVTHRWGHFS